MFKGGHWKCLFYLWNSGQEFTIIRNSSTWCDMLSYGISEFHFSSLVILDFSHICFFTRIPLPYGHVSLLEFLQFISESCLGIQNAGTLKCHWILSFFNPTGMFLYWNFRNSCLWNFWISRHSGILGCSLKLEHQEIPQKI